MNSKEVTNTIIFKNEEHKKFYQENLIKCRCQDAYRKALIYCIGISEDTRVNLNRIYDLRVDHIKTECLREGWQTSGSAKIVRMAFNLYCNGTPSIYDYDNEEEKLKECSRYTPEDLFCCEYARYFWEAIKIRYSEFCS